MKSALEHSNSHAAHLQRIASLEGALKLFLDETEFGLEFDWEEIIARMVKSEGCNPDWQERVDFLLGKIQTARCLLNESQGAR